MTARPAPDSRADRVNEWHGPECPYIVYNADQLIRSLRAGGYLVLDLSSPELAERIDAAIASVEVPSVQGVRRAVLAALGGGTPAKEPMAGRDFDINGDPW